MRLTAWMLLTCVAGNATAAQSWNEYAYPGDAFTVAFPAEPKVEITTYQATDGRAVTARIYSVVQEGGEFRMTVADLSGTGLPESAVVDHAIRTLTHGRETTVDIPHRVGRFYGRQLSTAGPDGSRSSVAIFYHNQRLYQIEGKALTGNDGTAEAIRFQQSLVFTD